MNTLTISEILQKCISKIGPVIPIDLNTDEVCRLDFSAKNQALANTSLQDTVAFAALVNYMLETNNAKIGIGGYLENRIIYTRSTHFTEIAGNRCIHLGIDIWAEAFTPVLAPLPGRIHSFKDNNNFGDYGPAIILEHELESQKFYTLYGHLTRKSLENMQIGQEIKQGEEFTQIGPFPENGDWPPHLHFQIITDLLGMEGDFPGVCTPKQKDRFAKICPNPNLILKCRHLD